ncbi:outer membrane protein [Devosia insulae]|nr:outer membrane protein [Devosia insulae]
MNKPMLLLAAGVSAQAISSASAADLIIDTPVEAGVVQASGNWDGAFIGVFGGYAWGELSVDDAPPGLLTPEPAGWLLGVNAGANFTLDNGIVLGVVGDIAWADIKDTLVQPPFGSVTSTLDWQGSLRGRIGFDGGAFLPYLTAGLAVAHNNVEAVGLGAGEDDAIHAGWTAGAGVELAATENLSVDLAYRYSDYGNADYTTGGGTGELHLTAHQVTVGLNWGF